MISQTKWIDRKFNFDFPVNMFPSFLERLRGTPIRVEKLILSYPDEILEFKPAGKWSLKERVGHIIDVEQLWEARLQQFKQNEKVLVSADMSNHRTETARHNEIEVTDLIKSLFHVRCNFISKLEKLTAEDVARSALHPRLNKPMRLVDMVYFIAEHDDHEIALMRYIGDKLLKE